MHTDWPTTLLQVRCRKAALLLCAAGIFHAEAALAAGASVWMDWRPRLAVSEGGGLIVGTIETERVPGPTGEEPPGGAGIAIGMDDSAAIISVVVRDTDSLLTRSDPDLLTPESRVWVFWMEVKPGNFYIERAQRFEGQRGLSATPKTRRPFAVRAGEATYAGRFLITGHNDACVRAIVGKHEPVRFFFRCLRGLYVENTDRFAEDRALAMKVLPDALRSVPWPETTLDPAFEPRERLSYPYLLERRLVERPDIRRTRPSDAEIDAIRKAVPPAPDRSRE